MGSPHPEGKKKKRFSRASGSLTVAGSEHSPLLPVITGMLRGRERQSKMMGFCTQGMRKWVPSPTTVSWTPRNRSKMTALWPASTREENSTSSADSLLPSVVPAHHQNLLRGKGLSGLVRAFCYRRPVKLIRLLGATRRKRRRSRDSWPPVCSQGQQVTDSFLEKGPCNPLACAVHEV